MCIDTHRNLLGIEGMAGTVRTPTLVVTNNSIERAILGTQRTFELFLTTEFLGCTTKSKFRAANIQGTFGGFSKVAIVISVTIGLSIAVYNTGVL